MADKTATIYDVATKAGVSPATVSRVLNEPSRVNADKRSRVLSAIAELHFVPRANAVANARAQYKKIGVIAPFFTEQSFMQRLRGIAAVLSGRHYELVVYAIASMEELEAYIDMLVSSRRVDGLIVLCLSVQKGAVEKLRISALPVCFVETDVTGFDSVIVENQIGGTLAAEHLYSLGYRNPAFVGEKSIRNYAVPATELRYKGFCAYFKEQHIIVKPENTWIGEFCEEKLEEGINSILAQKELPDCVFTSSDIIAIMFIKYAAKRGLKVPHDIGVIGFDDLDMTSLINLSTISQALDESGRLAAELILDRLKESQRAPRRVLVPLTVKGRDTTKRI